MRKQLFLAVSLPIVLLIAGCPRESAPVPAEDKSSESATAITEAPPASAGVRMQRAENAGETLECVPHQDEPPDTEHKRVTAGTYCVCDDGPPGSTQLHLTTKVEGPHLKKGNPIVIGTLAESTAVTLGASHLAFNQIEGGRGLSAMVAYPHVDRPESGRGEQIVPHLVNITAYKHPVGGQAPGNCDVNKNILKISYCYWAEEADEQAWKCPKDIPGPHLGDIHAQN